MSNNISIYVTAIHRVVEVMAGEEKSINIDCCEPLTGSMNIVSMYLYFDLEACSDARKSP